MARAPALFVSHGAPTVALEDDGFTRALARFGAGVAPPRAMVVVSAHWEAAAPVRVNAHPSPTLIYDFGGFPDALYRLKYTAPGDPLLAEEIAGLLGRAGLDHSVERDRGWDHGLWVPLRIAFPEARVPIVEVSLPVPRTPVELLEIGRALAPLREAGVLLVGSGGAVHNLRRLVWEDKDAPPVDWARAFDEWLAQRLEAGDFDGIAAYGDHAPHAGLAVPTSEHFDPIFFVLGSRAEDDGVTPVYEGFHYGTLSMRTFALAPA